MGCASSTAVDKGKAKTNEEPELMGKSKFLSCPAMSEVVDATQTKWLLIVFAPMTHHGLIFAARNAKDGSMLVKDIADKQVTKEKDEHKVSLGYNIFFKAISTEVAKANRSGAKVEWLSDGSMSVECKIAISGSASSNRKPDTYTVVLKPVPATEENLFKYIAEPLATHYCKKRTDGWNLDRPDPHKEKTYGEQEANSIMRAASMRASQKILDQELPNIIPLRQEHATARAERDAAVAKVNLMKQMLLCKTTEPPILSLPPEDAFAALTKLELHGLNAMSASVEPHVSHSKTTDVTAHLNAPAMSASPPAEVPPPNMNETRSFTAPSEAPLYQVGMAAFRGLDLVGTEEGQIREKQLRQFLVRVEALHRPWNAFHNARRAAERLQSMFIIVKTAMGQGFRPPRKAIANALIAAVIHDADHSGSNNTQGIRSTQGSYVPTLYNFDSHVERHSLAVGLCEARIQDISFDSDFVATLVIATDMSKHHEFMSRFVKRSKEVADFSRKAEDQVIAFTAMLKVADMCHLFKPKKECDGALHDLGTELRLGDAAIGVTSDVPDVRLLVTHIAKPLFASAASAYPGLKFAQEGCVENFG